MGEEEDPPIVEIIFISLTNWLWKMRFVRVFQQRGSCSYKTGRQQFHNE